VVKLLGQPGSQSWPMFSQFFTMEALFVTGKNKKERQKKQFKCPPIINFIM
jgi:hypothetical protein